ncbi:MAG: cob(I)yrinic acid a,c-diamide adenosyltransferase [Halobacteria archaeon]|nr:cob(I)yrinic acid a,c-diamide adenosyltransferase [Halobacteria archaeon]
MKIYTRRGDKGKTDLRSGDRVSKASPRIEAYGNVDEANAFIGFAVANLDSEEYQDVVEVLEEVQNHLFVAQADLANPNKTEKTENDDSSDGDDNDDTPRITDEDVEWLEDRCYDFDAELPELQSFILPSGAPSGSSLHLARTVTRRAERRVVALVDELESEGKETQQVENVLKYLNRVSDLLFVLGRVVNSREGVEEESPQY